MQQYAANHKVWWLSFLFGTKPDALVLSVFNFRNLHSVICSVLFISHVVTARIVSYHHIFSRICYRLHNQS